MLRMAAGLQHAAQSMVRFMQQCGNFMDTQPGVVELQWEMLMHRHQLSPTCYPFPSKTTPARQKDVFQQVQLRGSRTQGCLRACSSLEVLC